MKNEINIRIRHNLTPMHAEILNKMLQHTLEAVYKWTNANSVKDLDSVMFVNDKEVYYSKNNKKKF